MFLIYDVFHFNAILSIMLSNYEVFHFNVILSIMLSNYDVFSLQYDVIYHVIYL